MMILEYLRNKSFWMWDRLKKESIHKNLKDIKRILENPNDLNSNTSKKKHLDQLLSHATRTTPFYKRYKDCNLNEYPIINKALIRESENNFLSESFQKEKLYSSITSGSTGTPFRVYHDKRKKLRNYADTTYFAEKSGYKLGYKLYYLKIWPKSRMKSRLFYLIQNIVPIDVLEFSKSRINKLVRQLKRNHVNHAILGYASSLEQIAKVLNSKDIVFKNVRSVIAMSENLNQYTAETLSKAFKVPVLSRYSNLENGIIAQQIPESQGSFLINTASYYIELFNINSDIPAKKGDPGRIVVTDLFNYAMPLIRYDTGDIGYLSESDNSENMYFSKIEGRKMDLLYNTKGDLVSSFIVYRNMWQYTEINQYQLIQEGPKKYIIKINPFEVFHQHEKLVDEFKSYLGKDAEIQIKIVTEIPLLASGKRKKILNNYYSDN